MIHFSRRRKVISISGTSSGIGRACALKFDRLGMTVFATVRKTADADSLRAEASRQLVPLKMDVTDREQIASAADVVARHVEASDGKLRMLALLPDGLRDRIVRKSSGL